MPCPVAIATSPVLRSVYDHEDMFAILTGPLTYHIQSGNDMSKTTNIKPISYFKAHASEMLDTLRETSAPYVITQNGEAAAILVDPVEYDRMLEAIEMLKLIRQGESEIRKGQVLSVDAVRKRIQSARRKRKA